MQKLYLPIYFVHILSNYCILFLIENFRKTIKAASKAGDEGTVDMIGSFLENIEKSSWMLSAWSKNTKEVLDSSFVK